MIRKTLFSLIVIILSTLTVYSQDKDEKVKLYFFGQISDASQFGYKAPNGGMAVGGSYRLNDRITLLGEYTYDYSEKVFLDNGHSEAIVAGGRFYLITDAVFVEAKASLVSHENKTYSKRAFRGGVGIGMHDAGLTTVVSFFSPSNEIVPDPNTVRGVSVTGTYEFDLFSVGPIKVSSLSGGQFSSATFTQTGDLNGDRFRGNIWSGRTGLGIKF